MIRTISKHSLALTAWAALFAAPVANAQKVTDQWLFKRDYTNAIPGGKDLIPITSGNPDVIGPDASVTTFNVGAGGTFTWETAVIGGQTVPVSHFTQNAYFVVPHGAAANGGGSYVNQYTIIMDVMFPADFGVATATSSGDIALLNTTAANFNDADWKINPSGGMGIDGDFSDTGNPLVFTGGVWHRIALAFDATSPIGTNATTYRSFIDGKLQNVVQSPAQWGVDSQYTLYTKDDASTPWFTMFGEGNGGDATGFSEALNGYIHNFQFRDYAMSDADIAALGGPTAGPIPATTSAPAATVTGNIALEGVSDLAAISHRITDQWLFKNDYSNAISGGKALIPINDANNTVTGPAPNNTVTTFNVAPGGTFAWETAVVGGQTVPVSHFTQNAYFVVPHGIAANGGGSYVNQYTIVMDALFPADFATSGSGYVALLNTNASNGSPTSSNDADWYIYPSGGLGINGDSSDTGNPLLYTGGVWHRLALTLDDTSPAGSPATIYRSFIDGQLQNVVENPGSWSLNGRYSLYTKDDPNTPWFTMFAEGYDTSGYYEALNGYIHNMQLRNYAMSDAEVAALGVPTAGPIALTASTAPTVPLGTFDIQFRVPGTSTIVKEFPAVNLTTAAGSPKGAYSVSGVPQGVYDVWIKGAKNLAVLNAGVVISGTAATVPDATLPAGDANNDNFCDTTDFGLLVGTYGSSAAVSGSGYDPAEDFNFDGFVDTTDFGLLVGNYGQQGAK